MASIWTIVEKESGSILEKTEPLLYFQKLFGKLS